MKRDLLFDGVLEAEAEAVANDPGPRVWTRMRDIPAGTLATAAGRGEGVRLYINSHGLGWWIGDDMPAGTIAEGERMGWTVNSSRDQYGPFTEVLE